MYVFFVFKQKTAYEMRISDWSSDVCSSDLAENRLRNRRLEADGPLLFRPFRQCRADARGRNGELGRRDAQRWRFPTEHRAEVGFRHQLGRASCRERVCPYV